MHLALCEKFNFLTWHNFFIKFGIKLNKFMELTFHLFWSWLQFYYKSQSKNESNRIPYKTAR